MTNKLSPAAQAVREAAEKQTDLDFRYAPQIAAAALREAVEQVLPPEIDLPPAAPDAGHIRQNERRLVRLRLLNIATELENTDD